MSVLDDDLSAIDSDALALGLADSATYNGTSIIATFAESLEPYLGDEGAEKRRRTCTVSLRRSLVAAPAKGDRIVVASGAYSGTWVVIDAGTGDAGGWVVTARLDERATIGGGRRLP